MTLTDHVASAAVVVSLSGGKDSAAACLHLVELGIEHRRVYMDTGWEHADTYTHLGRLEERLGPIIRLRQPVPVLEGYEGEVAELEGLLGVESPMVRLCVWKGGFPGQGSRWCTSHLKAVPSARWLAEQDGEVVNVVGIRREESVKRRGYAEWEDMPRTEVNPVIRLEAQLRWIELGHMD